MFNGLPLGSAGPLVTDRHDQAQGIGDLVLDLLFEDPPGCRVGGAAIGFDEQVRRPWKRLRHFRATAFDQIIDGEGRGIGRLADLQTGLVMVQVIDTIGHGTALGILGKIMVVHLFGVLTPDLSSVLEIADQFLLFRIDAHRRLSRLFMPGALLIDMGKLALSVRMVCAFSVFAIGVQPIIMRLQQSADDG